MYKFFKFLFCIILFFHTSFNAALCENVIQAEDLINKAQTAFTSDEKYNFLHKAIDLLLEDYEENPLNIRILLDLSKANQLLGYRKEAKIYVLKAYNLNPNDANLQKEMGDFYYTFQEYSTAIEYYKLSLASGNLRDYKTNLKTAKCFEKLGDIKNADLYYKICKHLKET